MQIESISFHDLTPTGEVELIVKGGRRELFSLGPVAVEVIKRNVGNRSEGYVFISPRTGDRVRSIHNGFNQAVRKLGLTVNGTKLRIHDLRHVHATWLYQAGISLDVIGLLLGHRNRLVTDRYITYDRLSHSKALSLLPKINRVKKTGKNWQDKPKEHVLFLPHTAVSN